MAKGFLDGYKKYDPSDGFGNPKQWKGAFHQRMSKEDAQVILDESQETPEAVLGVRIGATLAEIKQAYRRLMKVWHPDFNAHRLEEALRMSKKIIAANELLTD